MRAASGRGQARGAAPVTVVAGVSGGAGASTLAALLAAARVGTGPVALVDLGAGGGLDVLLGLERSPGARWPELADVRGAVEPQDLEGLMPRWRGVDVLSAARDGAQPPVEVVLEVVRALRAGGASVVLDADGRGAERWAVTRELVAGGGDVVLVASQDVLGLASVLAARGAVEVGAAQLVLRRRPSTISALELASVCDLPLLGVLPHDRRLAGAVDRGLGPVAGRRLRRAVAGVQRRLGGEP